MEDQKRREERCKNILPSFCHNPWWENKVLKGFSRLATINRLTQLTYLSDFEVKTFNF